MNNKAAVAIIAFNRPDKVKILLNSLVGQTFRKAYIIVDGARNDEDKILISDTIKLINSHKWGCPIIFNISEENLGCKKRVSSGISWVFEAEDDAIILEDDTIPHPSFFTFAWEMIEKYRENAQVMHISGCNLHFGKRFSTDCYYFSKYPHIWGWATWKRAWQKYDPDVRDWSINKEKFMESTYYKNSARNWALKLERAYRNELDTWDFQWLYTILINNGLCIQTETNLIKNIGFDLSATHKSFPFLKNKYTTLEVQSIIDPIRHPKKIAENQEADQAYEATLDNHIFYRLKDFIYHTFM